MIRLLKLACIGVFCFTSSSLFAVDVMPIDPNSQDFDKGKCIKDATESCISEICITSEERNCQDNCKKSAEQKCK